MPKADASVVAVNP
jgi:hypothetical protein